MIGRSLVYEEGCERLELYEEGRETEGEALGGDALEVFKQMNLKSRDAERRPSMRERRTQ